MQRHPNFVGAARALLGRRAATLSDVTASCYGLCGLEGLFAMKAPTRVTIAIEPEAGGRWIPEIAALPGVLAYGKKRGERP